jgi:hypothetical protein
MSGAHQLADPNLTGSGAWVSGVKFFFRRMRDSGTVAPFVTTTRYGDGAVLTA